ncbi:MAG: FtsX-like permease family protein [Candidatus Schekmanbacteria bacterium]|nr:FtsX-like permease family protein [Candidatus Schekmanbacteria bacterium]
MNFIALKMLIGDRAKYIGILTGLTFASLLITQQLGIFTGIMARAYGAISDASLPDIWVMDSKVQYIDDIKPLKDTQVLRVRGVKGVEWAVPLYRGLLRVRMEDGNFQTCSVMGLDDATLIGGPSEMVQGKLSDLRQSDSVIVDIVASQKKLAKPPLTPDGERIPLKLGDTLELNDHRAVVAGFFRGSKVFMAFPVIYTTYSRTKIFAPQERKSLSFILVKAKPGQDIAALCDRIQRQTGLGAHTKDQFKMITIQYFLKNTGIPVNFGIAVTLGFVVGVIIAGQTFYNFTVENLRYFGTLKAMGATNGKLLRMIILQALVVGSIGYGLGVGAASSIGYLARNTELAFKLPWQILVISGTAIVIICLISALLSIHKVMKLEPAIVFKG